MEFVGTFFGAVGGDLFDGELKGADGGTVEEFGAEGFG